MSKTFKKKKSIYETIRLALPAKPGRPMTSKHGKKHYERKSAKFEFRQIKAEA